MDLEDRVTSIKFPISKNDISEDLIREITRSLIFKHRFEIRHDGLLWEIIKHTKCTAAESVMIIQEMCDLGLRFCIDELQMYNPYSLTSFAKMRDYVTDNEIDQAYAEIAERENKLEQIYKQYEEKYGKDTCKWPKGVWDEYETLEINLLNDKSS